MEFGHKNCLTFCLFMHYATMRIHLNRYILLNVLNRTKKVYSSPIKHKSYVSSTLYNCMQLSRRKTIASPTLLGSKIWTYPDSQSSPFHVFALITIFFLPITVSFYLVLNPFAPYTTTKLYVTFIALFTLVPLFLISAIHYLRNSLL